MSHGRVLHKLGRKCCVPRACPRYTVEKRWCSLGLLTTPDKQNFLQCGNVQPKTRRTGTCATHHSLLPCNYGASTRPPKRGWRGGLGDARSECKIKRARTTYGGAWRQLQPRRDRVVKTKEIALCVRLRGAKGCARTEVDGIQKTACSTCNVSYLAMTVTVAAPIGKTIAPTLLLHELALELSSSAKRATPARLPHPC